VSTGSTSARKHDEAWGDQDASQAGELCRAALSMQKWHPFLKSMGIGWEWVGSFLVKLCIEWLSLSVTI
jgi:hypothetical protein